MIQEQETFDTYGYYPSGLIPGSHEPILAACDDCGEVRKMPRYEYRLLCHSCARKGNTNSFGYKHTVEAKANMSAAQKGKILSGSQKVKMSAAHKGKTFSEEHKANLSASHFKGGKKLAEKRHRAKRRKLGYNLLMSLKEDEVGHHITDEHVIGIPKEVHEKFSPGPGGRERHRAKVLKWLKDNDVKKHEIVMEVLAKKYYPEV